MPVVGLSPPKTNNLLTLGAYTPEASAFSKSGTGARGVQVFVAGLKLPNWLIVPLAEKE